MDALTLAVLAQHEPDRSVAVPAHGVFCEMVYHAACLYEIHSGIPPAYIAQVTIDLSVLTFLHRNCFKFNCQRGRLGIDLAR